MPSVVQAQHPTSSPDLLTGPRPITADNGTSFVSSSAPAAASSLLYPYSDTLPPLIPAQNCLTHPLTRTTSSPPIAPPPRHHRNSSAANSVASLLLDGILLDDSPTDAHKIVIPANYDPKTKCLRLQKETLAAFNRIIKVEAGNKRKEGEGEKREGGCEERCWGWLEGLPDMVEEDGDEVVVPVEGEGVRGVWRRILGKLVGGVHHGDGAKERPKERRRWSHGSRKRETAGLRRGQSDMTGTSGHT